MASLRSGSIANAGFAIDEVVSSLPMVVADPILRVLGELGWQHMHLKMRFNATGWFGIRRLRIEAWLRRWRMLSIRYGQERVWVERWLHMIDRCLTKRPEAVGPMVQSATMIRGYGDTYRYGMANWTLIIDSLVKPVFAGTLALDDLSAAIAEARAAALPDRRQTALKRGHCRDPDPGRERRHDLGVGDALEGERDCNARLHREIRSWHASRRFRHVHSGTENVIKDHWSVLTGCDAQRSRGRSARIERRSRRSRRVWSRRAQAKGVSLILPQMSSTVAVGALTGWMLVLTIKHVLADFYLQNAWMALGKDKKTGWALPLLAHCAVHLVLTTAVMLILAPRYWFIGLIDFVIHLAIDRTKGFIVATFNVTPENQMVLVADRH